MNVSSVLHSIIFNNLTRHIVVVAALTGMGVFLQSDKPVTIRFPESRNITVHSASTTLTAEYDTSRVRKVLLLKPFSARQEFPVAQQDQKMEFARHLYRMIPRNLFLSHVTVETNREVLDYQFPLERQVDLNQFWQSSELQRIWGSIHHVKTLSVDVALEGWTRALFHSTTEARATAGNFFSISMQLKPGLNNFQLMPLDSAGIPLMLDSLQVFYAVPTSYESPPDDSEPVIFHSSPAEEQCRTCHTDIAGTCTSCHRGLVSLPSVHPVAEDCSLCHDLSSSKDFRLIAEPDINAEFCFTCHDDKRELLETKPVVHGVATECLMCHDAHGSTYDYMVRDRTTNLCKMCHEERATQSHPVAGHPMEGPQDPYRPGKKLTCTSCHNPHASDHARLFRFPEVPICQYCHGKR